MALEQLGKTLQAFGQEAKAEVKESAETFSINSRINEEVKQLDGHTLCSGIATGCTAVMDPRVPSYPNYEEVYRQTAAMWNAFILKQNPNVPELPEWPVYDKDTRLAMFLDVESHVGEIEHTDPNISTQTLRL